jgi:DNA-binding MarR family transcriptional regulator
MKKKEQLSQAIAQLMPNIIQGVHIGFLSKTKLTHTQFFVLVAIHSRGRPTMRALSDNMQVSMPTMTGIIERLVKAGYVRRVLLKEDRRQVLVELTADGAQIIKRFQIAAMERWQQVLSVLNNSEIGNFQDIVVKLNQSIQQRKIHETN